MRRGVASGIALLGLVVLASPGASAASTFAVNSTASTPGGGDPADGVCETAPGSGVCTLPAAVAEANAIPGGGATIVLPPGVYVPGVLVLQQSMTVAGEAPSSTVLEGSGRIETTPGTTVRIAALTASLRNRSGGVIENPAGATLALENVVVADNLDCDEEYTALGIVNAGALSMRHAVVRNNGSGCSWGHNIGGGMLNEAGGAARIEDSLIAGNRAEWGAGIANYGELEIERTSIVHNDVVYEGAGIWNAGSLELVNVTLSENSMPWNHANADGGGLFSEEGETRIAASTIAGNVVGGSADPGGDGGGLFLAGTGSLLLSGSIVAGNRILADVPDECGGAVPITSGDHLVIGARSTCVLDGALEHVNTEDVDAGLGPLAALGGFGLSQAAGAGVRAIPAASCLDASGAPLALDGRGYARHGDCDVGAIQSGAGYAPEALDGRELLRNGGAAGEELGQAWALGNEAPPPPWSWRITPPPYWVQEAGSFRQVLYGSPDLPTRADAPAGSGAYFFAAGNVALSRSSQTIDLSAHAAAIDAGGVPFRAAGAFGGSGAEEDHATMAVSFRDAGGALLDQLTLGGFSAAERGGVTKLLPDVETGAVPAGTRQVVVAIAAQRAEPAPFAYNDGYADALSFTVPEQGHAAAAVATLGALGWRRLRTRS